LKLETVSTGKTLDEAIDAGCKELGIARETAEIEVLERPKKGFLGLKFTPAKVKVSFEKSKGEAAREYIAAILAKMGLEVKVTAEEKEDGIVLNLDGEGLGVVIGRRGETLDALQYLASLVANRDGGQYMRVSINIGDYRKKREETLQMLAKKLATQAVRTGRSVTLEPMNPYERRVIHSAVQEVEGATSRSIGEEPNRRVVISSTAPRKSGNGGNRKPGGRGGRSYNNRPRSDKPVSKPAEGDKDEAAVQTEMPVNAEAPAETAAEQPQRSEYTERPERSDRPERSGERRYRDDNRRGGDRGDRGGRGGSRGPRPPKPAPVASTRPAEVKEEAKDMPMYGKIEL